jgi:hypothetical protein
MVDDPAPLTLPADVCEQRGWELVEQSTETLFELPTARIQGTMVRYDDERTRTALRGATAEAVDHPIRFFATTRLTFEPSLPPGTGPAMIMPVLLSEARQNFKRRLRDRGLVDVSREGTERVRSGDRNWVRLTRYSARDPEVSGDGLPLECWLGVWTDETVAMATAGYPTVSLAEQFDLETTESALTKDGRTYREEFRSLIREL